MEPFKILFDNGKDKCIRFSIDDEDQEDKFLSVNQYLLIHDNMGVVIDPGSAAIFHDLCDLISQFIPLENIKFVFFSHQDPDVAGSISEWSVSTSTKFVMSSLWTRFMSHYGLLDMERIFALPDQGTKIPFGSGFIQFLPAHFLHSPGNFSLYESHSKILFSGDIGAAVIPSMEGEKEVVDFQTHVSYMEGFHQRYMAGNTFCKAWVRNVEQFPISMIAPQHGAVFKDENVKKFLDWFDALECGGDRMELLY